MSKLHLLSDLINSGNEMSSNASTAEDCIKALADCVVIVFEWYLSVKLMKS
jgi:hypothetical protein